MSRFWLGLGTNLGDRWDALAGAVAWLRADGHALEAVSPVYETAPQDVEDQPAFLNAAARVRSLLDPPGMLRAAKALEAALGRAPGPRYGPRAIDCDVLLWDGGAWSDPPSLEVPHPRLAERRFALLPLLDLDPDLTLPDGRRVADLAAAIPAEAQPAAIAEPPRGAPPLR